VGDRSCKIDIKPDIPMNNKTPPSEMIRVPTVLIPVVRNLAKIHRDGHTTALLQGLQELITQFDSSVKLEVTDELQQVEEKLGELETHLCQQDQQVDSKIEALSKQLEKIERAIVSGRYSGGNSRQRYSGYQYQQQPVEIKSFAPENLAQRLGVTQKSLTTERETKSEQEFISWSRNRDPSSLGWKFQVSDGLYYPVKQ
jgi:hypothetical protein